MSTVELIDPVTDRDRVLGPADAPVTLVEYGDYECPDCLNAFPIVQQLIQRLGRRLRFVYRHFPRNSIHPHASVAAQAAEAAGEQGKFWKMHEALFKNQQRLGELDLSHLALNIGCEIYRFQSDLAGAALGRRVREQYESGVRSGVTATPTFFVNGARYRGRHEFQALLEAINSAAGGPERHGGAG
jgi:protein-disulfide isomerase